MEKHIEKPFKNPFYDVLVGAFLGKSEFIDWVKDKFIKSKEKDRELSAINKLRDKNITVDIIREKTKNENLFSEKTRKQVEIYLIHKYTQEKLNDIQTVYPELSISGISQNCRRLEIKRKKDRKLNELISKIEKGLD